MGYGPVAMPRYFFVVTYGLVCKKTPKGTRPDARYCLLSTRSKGSRQ